MERFFFLKYRTLERIKYLVLVLLQDAFDHESRKNLNDFLYVGLSSGMAPVHGEQKNRAQVTALFYFHD